jgi:hypothetical protein
MLPFISVPSLFREAGNYLHWAIAGKDTELCVWAVRKGWVLVGVAVRTS